MRRQEWGDRRVEEGRPVAMDVLACRGAAEEALAWVRAGKGPIILEMKTYRYRGHSMSDPAKYRTKEEVAKMRKESDPLDTLRGFMLERQLVDEARLKEIDRDVRAIVNESAEFAQTSPEPDPSELYTDILIEA